MSFWKKLRKIFAIVVVVAAVIFAPAAIAALAGTGTALAGTALAGLTGITAGSTLMAGALYGAAAGAVAGGLWTGTLKGAVKGAAVGGLIGGAAGYAGVGQAATATSKGGAFGTGIGTGSPGAGMGGWSAVPGASAPVSGVAAPAATPAIPGPAPLDVVGNPVLQQSTASSVVQPLAGAAPKPGGFMNALANISPGAGALGAGVAVMAGNTLQGVGAGMAAKDAAEAKNKKDEEDQARRNMQADLSLYKTTYGGPQYTPVGLIGQA